MAFKSDGLSTKSVTFLLLFETSRLSGGMSTVWTSVLGIFKRWPQSQPVLVLRKWQVCALSSFRCLFSIQNTVLNYSFDSEPQSRLRNHIWLKRRFNVLHSVVILYKCQWWVLLLIRSRAPQTTVDLKFQNFFWCGPKFLQIYY